MIEETILSNLLFNDQYAREVNPYIKSEYFPKSEQQIIHRLIYKHFTKYNTHATKETLFIDLQNKRIDEALYNASVKVIESLQSTPVDFDWLKDKSEEYCKDRAFKNALRQCILLESDPNANKDSAPKIMEEALAVSFTESLGHNYLNDAYLRYRFYHEPHNRVPFGLEMLNVVTQGGLITKTMLIYVAGTAGGKTQMMGQNAIDYLMQGKNVLYISLEMSPEMLAERVDANLMDVTMEELKELSESVYMARIDALKGMTTGDLVYEQFPNGAHVGHFRHFIQQYKRKKNKKFDLVIVDYLNICGSQHMKKSDGNSYTYIKQVVEELRGLAIEEDVRMISATQVNRDGLDNTELTLQNISDSIGTAFTADWVLALWRTDELRKMNQIAVKQLKNRYGDPTKPSVFNLGLIGDKMRFFNLEGQEVSVPVNVPRFDNTSKSNEDDSMETLFVYQQKEQQVREKFNEIFKVDPSDRPKDIIDTDNPF